MNLRVGVNLTWLTPGVVGGSEESTVEMLNAVLDNAVFDIGGVEPAPDLVAFVTPEFTETHAALCDRLEVHVMPPLRRIRGDVRPARILAEHRWLPGAAKRAGVALMHHAGGTAPIVRIERSSMPLPYTLTVHDLQPLDLPGNFGPAKRAYLRAVLGRSARRARRIGTPSEFVRRGVIARFGISPGSVVVVPWCTAPAVGEHADPGGMRRRLGVGPRYLLMPAITHPHKNHLTMLAAFDRAAAADPTIELVLAGGAGASEAEVAAAWAAMHHPDRVHRLGRIDREDLEGLYAGALATVFPTRYEGFGLPVLEAMQRRCPVICSPSGGVAEVAGAAAKLVDPDDTDGWVDAIAEVASLDHDDRERMVEAGLAQAATFSPARTAAAVLALWA